jgi:trans-aconitate methyltransferase
MAAPDEPRYDWKGWRGDKWLAHLDAMGAMLRPVDAPLLDALALCGPCRVADIGCGGGDTTRAVLCGAEAGSEVHGFDLHPGLVEAARARAGQARFHACNIERHPIPEAGFDRLVSRFGVMFFEDPRSAFSRLRRWLRPGGRLAFAVWGPPQDNPWITVVREVVGSVVALPEPVLDAPGPFRYAPSLALVRALRQAGFQAADQRDWRDSLEMGGGMNAAAAARFAVASFSSFAQLLERAGPQAVLAATEALTGRLTAHEQDGVVRLPARVWLVTARR